MGNAHRLLRGVEQLGPGFEESAARRLGVDLQPRGMTAHFTTASGDAIDNGHVFVDKSVAMKDLTMAARLAAVRSGRMRSANESVKVLLQHHAAMLPQRVEVWSKKIRMAPPKKRLRKKTDLASVNLNRVLTQLAQPTKVD